MYVGPGKALELFDQLETDRVSERHWPAILKALQAAHRRLDEDQRRFQEMKRPGISVVAEDE
jgi:hypothetical protein